jgi:hypothetical protein
LQTEKCAPTPARALKPQAQRLRVHVLQMINFEKSAKLSKGENQDPQTRRPGAFRGSHMQLSLTDILLVGLARAACRKRNVERDK